MPRCLVAGVAVIPPIQSWPWWSLLLLGLAHGILAGAVLTLDRRTDPCPPGFWLKDRGVDGTGPGGTIRRIEYHCERLP